MKTSDLIQLLFAAAFVIILFLLFFCPIPATNDKYMGQALAALFGFISGTGITAGLLLSGNTKTTETSKTEDTATPLPETKGEPS